MERQIIKINKTTVNSQLADKSIDRTFSELIPKTEIISIDQFFDYYNQLFYDIPRDGNNSHKKLIVQSTEFYGNYKDSRDDLIESLEKRIKELEYQLLNTELGGVELEEKLEDFEFKTKPDFYQINVFGYVDRRGSKKDWVHMYDSGLVSLSNDSPGSISENITIDNEKMER